VLFGRCFYSSIADKVRHDETLIDKLPEEARERKFK